MKKVIDAKTDEFHDITIIGTLCLVITVKNVPQNGHIKCIFNETIDCLTKVEVFRCFVSSNILHKNCDHQNINERYIQNGGEEYTAKEST